MIVRKIEKQGCNTALLNVVSTLPTETISINNWSTDYPYAPTVKFTLAHDGDNLYILYRVSEDCCAALVDEDSGKVWTDSCCEAFISFDDTGYYNLESNCIGKVLLGFRKTKPDVVHADCDVLDKIRRVPSLGTETFSQRDGDIDWTLFLTVPKETFFRHNFQTLSGLRARGNFYKCGDNLSKPHFLSWHPIISLTPNFHLPEFFGGLMFE